MTAVNLNDLTVIKGQDKIKTYQFNTNVAKHYFCSTCGVYTHHQRRSDPNTFGVNIGCIDDIDPQEFYKLKVAVNDGHNHVMDKNNLKMNLVNECFAKVKKDCFKYISTQETKTEKFKKKDKMLKSFLIPVSFWIANKVEKNKTITVGLAGGQGTGKQLYHQ